MFAARVADRVGAPALISSGPPDSPASGARGDVGQASITAPKTGSRSATREARRSVTGGLSRNLSCRPARTPGPAASQTRLALQWSMHWYQA